MASDPPRSSEGGGEAPAPTNREGALKGPRRGGRLANVLARNISLLTMAAVSMLVLRLLVQSLGLAQYGLIAFSLQIVHIIGVAGTTMSSAAARYVTQSVARDEKDAAASYLTNTLACVLAAGAVAFVVVAAIGALLPDVPVSFLLMLLLGAIMSSVAGTLAVGNFVRERFVSDGILRSLSRILYGGVCYGLLVHVGLGIWSVPVALLAASLVLLVGFAWMLRRSLPAVKLRPSLIGRRRMFEVASYFGWMLLLHCGMYIYRAGTMWSVKAFLPGELLGKYAVAIAISNLMLQLFKSLSVLTTPGIYRDLARERFPAATRGVERYLFLLALFGGTAVTIFAFDGQSLLQLVLGRSAPPGTQPILVGCVLSAMLVSTNVPFSTFLAGLNFQKYLGLMWLAAGAVIVGLSVVLLRDGVDRLVLLAYLPGVVTISKNAIILPMAFRRWFAFSSLRAFLRKGALVAALIGAAVGLRIGAGCLLNQGGVWPLAVRVMVTGVPLGSYVLLRLFGRSPKGAAQATLPDQSTALTDDL